MNCMDILYLWRFPLIFWFLYSWKDKFCKFNVLNSILKAYFIFYFAHLWIQSLNCLCKPNINLLFNLIFGNWIFSFLIILRQKHLISCSLLITYGNLWNPADQIKFIECFSNLNFGYNYRHFSLIKIFRLNFSFLVSLDLCLFVIIP